MKCSLVRESVLENLDGDERLLFELYEIFMRSAPERLAELKQGFEAGDKELALRASHSLKGNAATIGANCTHEIAKRMNDLLRAGEFDDAQSMLPELSRCLHEVLNILSNEINS